MAWNKPSDDKNERDPWDEDDKKVKNNSKKHGERTRSFLEIIKFLNFLKNKKKIFFSSFKSFKYANNPITIIIVSTMIFLFSSGFYMIKESECGVVTCFGKFSYLASPGLNWKPILGYRVIPVDTETIKELVISDNFFTSDNNIIHSKVNIKYRISDPRKYLFSVDNPDSNVSSIALSVLNTVISNFSIEDILKEKDSLLCHFIQNKIKKEIMRYDMGIVILSVDFLKCDLPEEIQSSFEDVIRSQKDRDNCIKNAKIYVNNVQFNTHRKIQKILAKAQEYKLRIILEAQGEIIRFSKILPLYKQSKEITVRYLYINYIEKILSRINKLFIDSNNNKILSFSLNDLFIKKNNLISIPSRVNKNYNAKTDKVLLHDIKIKNRIKDSKFSARILDNIINQRELNSIRKNDLRIGQNRK